MPQVGGSFDAGSGRLVEKLRRTMKWGAALTKYTGQGRDIIRRVGYMTHEAPQGSSEGGAGGKGGAVQQGAGARRAAGRL